MDFLFLSGDRSQEIERKRNSVAILVHVFLGCKREGKTLIDSSSNELKRFGIILIKKHAK